MWTGIRTGRNRIALERSELERRYPAATLKNVNFENAELRSDSFLHELDETLDADITGANLKGAKLYCTESYWAEVLFDPTQRDKLPKGGMVQREMRLVRWIAKNWPSVQLKHDFQDCSVYLGDSHGSRSGAPQ